MTIHDFRRLSQMDDKQVKAWEYDVTARERMEDLGEPEPTKQDGLAVFRGVISLIFICLIPLAAAFVLGVFLKALVTFFGWGWGVFG